MAATLSLTKQSLRLHIHAPLQSCARTVPDRARYVPSMYLIRMRSLRPGESAISSATLSAPLRCWHPDPFHVKRPRYRGTGNLREAECEGLGATCTAPAPARAGCPAPRPRRGPSLGSAGAIASGVKWTLATDGDQHRRGLGRVGSPVHSAAAR